MGGTTSIAQLMEQKWIIVDDDGGRRNFALRIVIVIMINF